MNEIIIDKMAFESNKPLRGFMFKAWYLKSPKAEALVEISKEDGEIVKRFLWPAYKIWNIPAHEEDIVDGLLNGNSQGLNMAGSDGLGGNCYSHECDLTDTL